MRMIVFEDAGAARLGPLAQTRPVFELLCGAVPLVERQARCLAADEVGALVRPELAALCRWAWPDRPVNDSDFFRRGQAVLVNGRWLAPEALPGSDEPHVGLVGAQVAYVVPPDGPGDEPSPRALARRLAELREALPHRQVGGAMIDRPWDLVENNAAALAQDERHWRTHREAARLAGVTVTGPAERFLADPGARVEPFVHVDTTKGPVLLDRGAVVASFSRLEGPCYVGPHTQVLGARVSGSSFGPQCRVGGECEASIVHGHSNKAHVGFLGHSYVGEWVNFGSGTETSDLRNDYGKVSLTIGGERVETGLLKVGAFIGDHTKTSIGTLFNTGSVAGPFGMLLTNGCLMPRTIPAFCAVSDGKMRERTDLKAMFATAETMMGRRDVRWTAEHAEFFHDLYDRTSAERQALVRDTEQRRLRRVV
jgi:UDP-N-acetylglucosamine diphosphorylase/glucosamine-1-phosphate N-acetyltransferase